jgi:hypothetical protein
MTAKTTNQTTADHFLKEVSQLQRNAVFRPKSKLLVAQ